MSVANLVRYATLPFNASIFLTSTFISWISVVLDLHNSQYYLSASTLWVSVPSVLQNFSASIISDSEVLHIHVFSQYSSAFILQVHTLPDYVNLQTSPVLSNSRFRDSLFCIAVHDISVLSYSSLI